MGLSVTLPLESHLPSAPALWQKRQGKHQLYSYTIGNVHVYVWWKGVYTEVGCVIDRLWLRQCPVITQTETWWGLWQCDLRKDTDLELVSWESVADALFVLCAVWRMLPLCGAWRHVPVVGTAAVPYSAPSRRQVWVQHQALIIPDIICNQGHNYTFIQYSVLTI